MTDRELLELAAKAAEIGPLDFDYAEREGHGLYMGPRLPMPQGVIMAAMHTYWNPLTDDGDALRLAVKLFFNIHRTKDCVFVNGLEAQNYQLLEWHNDNPEAAARRAIVRAAAEIGKQKEGV